MAKKILIAAAIFILAFAATGYAASISTGLKVGTLGAGVEVGSKFNDSIGARVGFNHYSYDKMAQKEDIDYDLDIQLQTVSAIIDWHPFNGSFRFSLGAFYNNNEIEADAVPYSSYRIGDVTYSASEITSLKANVDFADDIAPYVGIGWDTSFTKEGGLGFLCELGVLYQGKPDVRLSATGPVAESAAFQEELSKERNQLQESMDNFEYYPVLALGITYRY
jgi:hypothetical protein